MLRKTASHRKEKKPEEWLYPNFRIQTQKSGIRQVFLKSQRKPEIYVRYQQLTRTVNHTYSYLYLLYSSQGKQMQLGPQRKKYDQLKIC